MSENYFILRFYHLFLTVLSLTTEAINFKNVRYNKLKNLRIQ